VLFIPEEARFATLLEFPEGGRKGKTPGQAVDDAMRAIERDNPQLAGVLPKTYQTFNALLLKALLKAFSTIPMDLEGDSFGKIYEYFLAEFAATEGSMGGEFYTPTAIVRLMVEILEPFEGRVLDPSVRLGRHVRPERALRGRAQEGRRALDPRHREGR
jgi:type I restriction enzyme M protein